MTKGENRYWVARLMLSLALFMVLLSLETMDAIFDRLMMPGSGKDDALATMAVRNANDSQQFTQRAGMRRGSAAGAILLWRGKISVSAETGQPLIRGLQRFGTGANTNVRNPE